MSPLEYEFDPTGQDPENLVDGEVQQISTGNGRAVVPSAGLFYTDSVALEMAANPGVPLVLGTDYNFEGFDSVITAKTGLETASVIVFDPNPSLTGDVVLTYQAVGGYEGRQNGLARQVLEALETLTNGPGLSWDSISGKPVEFPPEAHLHSMITDLKNLESLRDAVDGIRIALYTQKPFSNTIRDICDKVDFLSAIIADHRRDLNRIQVVQAGAVPPNATELVRGLIEIANSTEATAGVDAVRAMTPALVELVLAPVRDTANNLGTQVNTNTNTINTLNGRLDLVEPALATAEADILTLDGRVDGHDSDIAALQASIGVSHYAADIAARDALVGVDDNESVFVLDASADAVITSGWAIYRKLPPAAGGGWVLVQYEEFINSVASIGEWPQPIFLDWATGVLVAEGAITVPSGNMVGSTATSINLAAIPHPTIAGTFLNQYAFQFTPEIYYLGDWFDPGWSMRSNNVWYGVKVTHKRATNTLHVVSGEDGVGGPQFSLGSIKTGVANAPVRIRIQPMHRLV